MTNIRRALRRAIRQRESEQTGSTELDIVPFLDIVTNLMLFLLATSASIATVSEVRAELPGFGPGRAPPLGLSVTLTERGAVMATREGGVDAQCRVGGPVVPMAARGDEGFEVAAIARCAAVLHAAHPTEHTVVVSADPGIPYRDVIATMDALRSRDDVPLFPDVQISAGVR